MDTIRNFVCSNLRYVFCFKYTKDIESAKVLEVFKQILVERRLISIIKKLDLNQATVNLSIDSINICI